MIPRSLVILAVVLFAVQANADVWRCQKKGAKSWMYTETPQFADDETCEAVKGETYSHSNEVGKPAAASHSSSVARTASAANIGKHSSAKKPGKKKGPASRADARKPKYQISDTPSSNHKKKN